MITVHISYWRVGCKNIQPVIHTQCFGKWEYPKLVQEGETTSLSDALFDENLIEPFLKWYSTALSDCKSS